MNGRDVDEHRAFWLASLQGRLAYWHATGTDQGSSAEFASEVLDLLAGLPSGEQVALVELWGWRRLNTWRDAAPVYAPPEST